MTHQFSGPTRVPDLILERYRLGEMTPAETAAFERRLCHDDDLRERLRALDASDDEIRRRYPPAELASHVRQRLKARVADASRKTGAGSFVLQWKTVAALAGVLMLAILSPLLGPNDEPTNRIKGLEPTLLLFRKTADGSEPLADGARARSGDLIRIGYGAAGEAYGLILSVDGRGVVTLHLPRDGDSAVPLSSDSQVLLDFAYELDDAPRWERFYFVCGSAPFAAAPVIEAARRGATGNASAPVLPLRLNVKQSSVLLVKEVVP